MADTNNNMNSKWRIFFKASRVLIAEIKIIDAFNVKLSITVGAWLCVSFSFILEYAKICIVEGIVQFQPVRHRLGGQLSELNYNFNVDAALKG